MICCWYVVAFLLSCERLTALYSSVLTICIPPRFLWSVVVGERGLSIGRKKKKKTFRCILLVYVTGAPRDRLFCVWATQIGVFCSKVAGSCTIWRGSLAGCFFLLFSDVFCVVFFAWWRWFCFCFQGKGRKTNLFRGYYVQQWLVLLCHTLVEGSTCALYMYVFVTRLLFCFPCLLISKYFLPFFCLFSSDLIFGREKNRNRRRGRQLCWDWCANRGGRHIYALRPGRSIIEILSEVAVWVGWPHGSSRK